METMKEEVSVKTAGITQKASTVKNVSLVTIDPLVCRWTPPMCAALVGVTQLIQQETALMEMEDVSVDHSIQVLTVTDVTLGIMVIPAVIHVCVMSMERKGRCVRSEVGSAHASPTTMAVTVTDVLLATMDFQIASLVPVMELVHWVAIVMQSPVSAAVAPTMVDAIALSVLLDIMATQAASCVTVM
jgi:hypothetical protein